MWQDRGHADSHDRETDIVTMGETQQPLLPQACPEPIRAWGHPSFESGIRGDNMSYVVYYICTREAAVSCVR